MRAIDCVSSKKKLNGDLSKVKSCIKLVGFVNSTDEFVEQPKCEISILPPPLPLLTLNQNKIKNKRNKGQIVYVGNLLSHKNPLRLVEAIQSMDNVRLIIIGNGQEREPITRYLKQKNMTHNTHHLSLSHKYTHKHTHTHSLACCCFSLRVMCYA